MRTDQIIVPQSDTHRYEAVVRISEAIAACREPEELATTLAEEIGKFLNFDHLYFVVLKENTKEIEYLLWGKSPIPLADLPMEELPTWAAINSRKPRECFTYCVATASAWLLKTSTLFDFQHLPADRLSAKHRCFQDLRVRRHLARLLP